MLVTSRQMLNTLSTLTRQRGASQGYMAWSVSSLVPLSERRKVMLPWPTTTSPFLLASLWNLSLKVRGLVEPGMVRKAMVLLEGGDGGDGGVGGEGGGSAPVVGGVGAPVVGGEGVQGGGEVGDTPLHVVQVPRHPHPAVLQTLS